MCCDWSTMSADKQVQALESVSRGKTCIGTSLLAFTAYLTKTSFIFESTSLFVTLF